MRLVGSIKNGIGKGIQTLRNSKLFKKKPKTKEESIPPEVTDADVTIAKLKSEKRNINELIRKVATIRSNHVVG